MGEMLYQLSWTTLPGVLGLSCSEFRAAQTAALDNEGGVAVECVSEVESDSLTVERGGTFWAAAVSKHCDGV